MIEILNGDALEKIKLLKDKSVDSIMTSPPYWQLRDYGIAGQLGLEDTVEEYIEKLLDIFDECWRVLKDTGTVFINMGDTYSNVNSKFISGSNNKNYYILSIRDEGRGIAPENINKIFERFHKTNINNNGGTGLGLAIAHQIALRHNIKIDVKSKENIGTTFTFYLPNTPED